MFSTVGVPILLDVILPLLKIQKLLCPEDTDILYSALFDILHCTLNHTGRASDQLEECMSGLKAEVSPTPHLWCDSWCCSGGC